jgi:hypothetical protein
MLGKIIAVIHLSIVLFLSFYPFIVSKNIVYDYYYFGFLILLQLSWIICNHECPLSYLYKYTHYDNYKMGNTTTLDDFEELAGDSANNNTNMINLSKFADNVLTLFYIISVIIVGLRSKLTNIFLIIFVLIIVRFFYLFLNNAVGYNTKKSLSKILGNGYYYLEKIYDDYKIVKIHNEINMIISMIYILFLVYITYKNNKRLYK